MLSCNNCIHFNKLDSIPNEGICSNDVVNQYVYTLGEHGSQFIPVASFYCREHKRKINEVKQ